MVNVCFQFWSILNNVIIMGILIYGFWYAFVCTDVWYPAGSEFTDPWICYVHLQLLMPVIAKQLYQFLLPTSVMNISIAPHS